jgi:regulatory protein
MKNYPSEKEILERLRYLCSKSEKCAYDIREKLKSWNFEGNVQAVIQNLSDEGFINEERYAISVINDKIKFSKWGKGKVRYFLKGKGISNEIVKKNIDDFDADYEGIIAKELEKKLKSIKETDKLKRKQKLLSFAFQRGYDSDIVYKISEKLIG